MAQKKATKKVTLIEGNSKKIKRCFEEVIIDLENDLRRRNYNAKEQYACLCSDIQDLANKINQCFASFTGEGQGLSMLGKHPVAQIRYVKMLIEAIMEVREQKQQQLKLRKAQNQASMANLNSNNVYELLARKNIQISQLQEDIVRLKCNLQMAARKTKAIQQMSESNRQQGEDLLQVYRQNFGRVADLLKQSQSKQRQFIQTNQALNQQLQTVKQDFEFYKKNYKNRHNAVEDHRRLQERMEKDYQQKLKMALSQMQYRHKQALKAK